MKTLKNHKAILSAIVFFTMAACAYAYPPDNAAVLYYKAAVLYEVDDEMANMLADLQKEEIKVDDKIREFVKKNRLIINTVLDAAEVKNCDWGMNFSEGLEMNSPPLFALRKLTYLIVADAKILAEDGNYEEALSRCMSLYKMARHINDRTYISNLVGIAINGLTNGCVTQIMSEMPQDMQSLSRLKNQLTEIDSISFSVKPAILGEHEAMLLFMTKEKLADVARLCAEEESVKEKILALDETMIERNREYLKNLYAGIIAAFEMPYVQGYNTLNNLNEKLQEDLKKSSELILTEVLAPATHKIFSLSIRLKAHDNAIKTAIELYMIKAKTGKMPETIPAEFPGDPFSDKPFKYEKTDDGFILRCQGKDLVKDEAYEYKFKVK